MPRPLTKGPQVFDKKTWHFSLDKRGGSMALAGVIPLSKGSVRERLAGQSLTGVIPLSKGALSKGQCVDTPSLVKREL